MKITLKAARINRNLSIKDVCKSIGISESTLRRWESGATYPYLNQAVALCELYGVSLDDIEI